MAVEVDPGLASDTPQPARKRRQVLLHLTSLLVGLAGLMLAVIIPFAPVWSTSATVTWPAAGALPVSTTALLTPAKPAELHAFVPCPAIQAGGRYPAGATVLATSAPDTPTKGLAIVVRDRVVKVLLGGFETASVPVTAECDVRVDSTAALTTVRAGPNVAEVRGQQFVPDVHAFVTGLAAPEARGVQITARPQVWFENTPARSKITLIVAELALAVTALCLLARRGSRLREAPGRRDRTRWLVDAGVLAVLGVWWIIGPVTDDDGFATMTIRNGLLSGDIGNYYRWLNGSEAPFTLLQNMLEPLVATSLAPPVLRLPSVAAGIGLWFVASRGVLGAVLPRVSATWWCRLMAAAALLAWWLPFDLGVRSESFVALASTTVLALVLRATATERLLPLGLAVAIAALTLAFNPTGLIASVPLLALAPRIVRLLRDTSTSVLALAGRLALLACLGATTLVPMFADQSWTGVLKATEIHRYFGPSLPWYQELTTRYEYLLGYGNAEGAAGKRLPVLLTIALLVPVAMLISRRGRSLPGLREVHLPAVCACLGLAALWLTPSKWSHHFGALAGLGAVFLVSAVVLIVSAARHWRQDRAVLLAGAIGTGLAVVVTAVSFAGKNHWYAYAEYGLPWTESAVTPFNRPLLWLGAVAMFAAALMARAKLGGRQARSAALAAVSASPAVMVVLACVTSVAVLLGSFGYGLATQLRLGSYSMAEQNIRHLTGTSCGVVDKVVAMPDVPGGALRPVSPPAQLDGFREGTGFSPAPALDLPGVAGTKLLWGSNLSDRGGELNTGTLVSPWFALPAVGPDRDLAVSVAGRTGDGNRVALEFARSDPHGGGAQPLGERVLDDAYKDEDKRPQYPTDRIPKIDPQNVPSWRALEARSEQIPAGADRVRVRAADATSDSGGWVAVTQPRLREVKPLQAILNEHKPVLMSTDLPWSMPCIRDVPVMRQGIAATPRVLVLPHSGFGGIGGGPFDENIGGTFAGLREMSSTPEIPTRLVGGELIPKQAEWGHLKLVDTSMNNDAYSVQTEQTRRWGWE